MSSGYKRDVALIFGIEFEYLLIDRARQIRDFSTLAYADISAWLEDKPGIDDPLLATGDLGIRRGYWYLEGDERFDEHGEFCTMAVKGVEIRTPPRASVAAAIISLLDIERQLAARLHAHGLGLAIVGFNPVQPQYTYHPPLNAFEVQTLATAAPGHAPQVSTLSYGPDINVSSADWTALHALTIARRLTYYSPFIVPFSFSAPFHAGACWPGLSKRTFERCRVRPSAKLYVGADTGLDSPLVYPARQASEQGRIEFKAFDAMPDLDRLAACCHLIVGIALADELSGSRETPDIEQHQRAAVAGFDDEAIRHTAATVLQASARALRRAGLVEGAEAVLSLQADITQRRTPAHGMIDNFHRCGELFHVGGFAMAPSC